MRGGVASNAVTTRFPDLCAHSETPSRGWVVEFFGPSGVGKSTLVRSLQSHLATTWFLPQHAAKLMPDSVAEEQLELLHREIFIRQLQRLSQSEGGVVNMAIRARHQAGILLTDLVLRQGGFPRGFLLDEGVFQCFAGTVASLEETDFATLLRNRAFVLLCPRDPTTVVQRYMDRTNSRKAEGRFPGVCRTREAELDRVNTSIRQHVANCDRAERLGAPVLRLVAEDDVIVNQQKFKDFENLLFSRGGVLRQRAT